MGISFKHHGLQTIPLLLIMGIAAVFRLYHLDAHSLWLDEAYSYQFSLLNWHELAFNLSAYETHSPLYYSVLKLWVGVFGYSEYAMRSLSVLASLASVPLVYGAAILVSENQSNRKMGLLAAFMFSLSSLQINHAQDVRPYAFYTFAMALSTFCICWLWSRRYILMGSFTKIRHSAPNAIFIYIGLGLGIALLQWLHNTAVTFILPLMFVLLWWWIVMCRGNRTIFLSLCFSALCAVLFYAPYLPQFIGQVGNFSVSDFWLSPPNTPYLFSSTMLLYGPEPQWLPVFLRAVIFLFTILPLFIISIWSFIRMHKSYSLRNNPVWLLLILSILPWALNLTLTFFFRPIYMERVLIPVQVPWFILLSAAPFAFKIPQKTYLILMMAGLSLISAVGYHCRTETVPHHIERWREFSEILIETKDLSPTIISLTEYPQLPLKYYADRLGLKPNFVTIAKKDVRALSQQTAKNLLKPVQNRKTIWVAIISPYTQRPAPLMKELLKTHRLERIVSYAPEGGDEFLEFTRK